jgi:type 1 fimbriae regulatory protein FimB
MVALLESTEKRKMTTQTITRKRHYVGNDRPSLTVEELKNLLHAARPDKQASIRNLAMFLVCAIHGLRVSELCDLRTTDLDMENGKILIRRLKGSQNSNQAMQRLNGWSEQAVLADWLKERKTATGADTDVLFPSQKTSADGGRVLDRSRVFRIFGTLCENAGIPQEKRHPHAIRHTLGNLLYQNGARLEDIQQVLGHRNITSTTVYAKPSQSQVDAKVAKVFKAMR